MIDFDDFSKRYQDHNKAIAEANVCYRRDCRQAYQVNLLRSGVAHLRRHLPWIHLRKLTPPPSANRRFHFQGRPGAPGISHRRARESPPR